MDEIFAGHARQTRDPHRRWMRHTYQEGLGFRFLATRGGRPPEREMPRSNLDSVRARARLLRLAREEGTAAVLAIKTQVNTPWTNGKIESFWATLKSEVLDRQVFRSIEAAEAALAEFARYYNYHRLHGEIGWLTPAERFDGTPFTDRGFDNIPALRHLTPWLVELRKAA